MNILLKQFVTYNTLESLDLFLIVGEGNVIDFTFWEQSPFITQSC